MKLMILAQYGGICPRELLNTIALEALPMLKGEKTPVKFDYSDCTGLISTRGVYTTFCALYGLIITAEVEHEELQKKITVRMVLSPKLREENLIFSYEENLPSPQWMSTAYDEDEIGPGIEELEVMALN